MTTMYHWDYWLAAATGFIVFKVFQRLLGVAQRRSSNVICSPRSTVSNDALAAHMAYPADIYPGGRDVVSPYGSMKIYEWGPKNGRKVLFLHGISTPAIALGQTAQELVDRGCRVMVFGMSFRYASHILLEGSSERFVTVFSMPLTVFELRILSHLLEICSGEDTQRRLRIYLTMYVYIPAKYCWPYLPLLCHGLAFLAST